MIRVLVPAPLRSFTRASEVAVEATTLREALAALERAAPGIGGRILGEKGEIRRFVNVFVNAKDARGLGDLDAPLADGDVISIVPAIAGGADPTFRDLLAGLKGKIPEVEPDAASAERARDRSLVLVDVREQDEVDQGAIAGAIHIPRGFLELRIEEKVPGRETPIVAYCAGGVRSMLAVESLRRLGYGNVRSMTGGFAKWRALGLPFTAPRRLSEPERRASARSASSTSTSSTSRTSSARSSTRPRASASGRRSRRGGRSTSSTPRRRSWRTTSA
jgi:sulfur-carrier protein adenylyltransferase/sulfurtransferase